MILLKLNKCTMLCDIVIASHGEAISSLPGLLRHPAYSGIPRNDILLHSSGIIEPYFNEAEFFPGFLTRKEALP